MRVTTIVATVALAAGCGKSAEDTRRDRCAQTWSQMQEMAKMFGDTLPDDVKGELRGAKDKFMAVCTTLPAEALPCLADPAKRETPECKKVLDKVEGELASSGPAPTLEWETVSVDHGRISARVPKGWEHDDFMGDKYAPTREADLGFFTEIVVASGCNGSCEKLPAAEWAKRVDEAVLAPARAAPKVIKDEALGATGRLLITAQTSTRGNAGGDVQVIAAWWSDGAEHYVTCTADLDGSAVAAVDAFEQACRDVEVKSWGSEN